MTRINLLHNKATIPVPKLNTLEYTVYLILLTSICIGLLGLLVYTSYLINTIDFYSIIKN